jgi:hypothetical protein
MSSLTAARIEPAPEILAASRRWLDPVRGALRDDFLAAYLTGSVLTQGFDPARSEVNLLIVTHPVDLTMLDALAQALPDSRQTPRFAPLFLSERQIHKSLDTFPIEWIEIQERHLLLEGKDVLGNLEIPRTYLRLQCEHELRAKLILLRQSYLLNCQRPERLEPVLRENASGFATLFRTLLRLAGESPPAETAQVIERVADVHGLQAEGLLGPHLIRTSGRRSKPQEVLAVYRKFVVEVERLVNNIDEMRVK